MSDSDCYSDVTVSDSDSDYDEETSPLELLHKTTRPRITMEGAITWLIVLITVGASMYTLVAYTVCRAYTNPIRWASCIIITTISVTGFIVISFWVSVVKNPKMYLLVMGMQLGFQAIPLVALFNLKIQDHGQLCSYHRHWFYMEIVNEVTIAIVVAAFLTVAKFVMYKRHYLHQSHITPTKTS
jgi:hypothetical protein